MEQAFELDFCKVGCQVCKKSLHFQAISDEAKECPVVLVWTPPEQPFLAHRSCFEESRRAVSLAVTRKIQCHSDMPQECKSCCENDHTLIRRALDPEVKRIAVYAFYKDGLLGPNRLVPMSILVHPYATVGTVNINEIDVRLGRKGFSDILFQLPIDFELEDRLATRLSDHHGWMLDALDSVRRRWADVALQSLQIGWPTNTTSRIVRAYIVARLRMPRDVLVMWPPAATAGFMMDEHSMFMSGMGDTAASFSSFVCDELADKFTMVKDPALSYTVGTCLATSVCRTTLAHEDCINIEINCADRSLCPVCLDVTQDRDEAPHWFVVSGTTSTIMPCVVYDPVTSQAVRDVMRERIVPYTVFSTKNL